MASRLQHQSEMPAGRSTATRVRQTQNSDPAAALDAVRRGVPLSQIEQRAAGCRACDLWKRATQTVFGSGSHDASIVLVGEQPGNEEDLQGEPFVGPAGRLLDKALAAAGIDRSQVYVTNVVKHFSWEERGKWRIQSPRRRRPVALRRGRHRLRPRQPPACGVACRHPRTDRATRSSRDQKYRTRPAADADLLRPTRVYRKGQRNGPRQTLARVERTLFAPFAPLRGQTLFASFAPLRGHLRSA